MEPRKIRILCIGRSSEYPDANEALEHGIELYCDGLQTEVASLPTLEDIGQIIERAPDDPFDIIYLMNETGMSLADLSKGCEELAKALAKLQMKPMIVFEWIGFDFLSIAFRQHGLIPRSGRLLDVVEKYSKEPGRSVPSQS